MQLPKIQYGGVESLAKPNIQADANAAQLPFNASAALITEAYQTFDSFKLLDEQEKALANSNEANEVLSYVNQLENPEVNLSNLPSHIAEAYRNSPDYDERNSGFLGEDEYVPSHKVSSHVMDWSEKQLAGIYSKGGSLREKALYSQYVGKSTQAAFKKAATGIRTSQLEALTDQTNLAIENSNAAGLIDKSLELVDNADNIGVYDPTAAAAARKDVFSYFKERDTEALDQLVRNVEIAERNGNPDLAVAFEEQYNAYLNDTRSYGDERMTIEENNEYVRKFDVAAARGEVEGESFRVRDTLGADAAVSGLMKLQQENEVPKGVTQQEYDNILSGAIQQNQAFKNLLKSSVPAVKNKLVRQENVTTMNAQTDLYGAISDKGAGYKAFSEEYDAMLAGLNAEGKGWEVTLNATLDYMKTYGNMPDGVKQQFNGIRNMSPERQIEVAELYAATRLLEGGIADKYTGSNRAYLDYIANEVAFGGDRSASLVALENAEKRFGSDIDSGNAATFAMNLESHKDFTSGEGLTAQTDSYIKNNFEKDYLWWATQPKMQQQARLAFQHHYVDAIGRGATPESAFDSASAETNSRFGAGFSDPKFPNGKLEVMPVNKIYGDWSLEQFKAFTAEKFAKESAIEGGQFYLEADGLTLFQPNPTYKVMFRTNDGEEGYQVSSWNDESPNGIAGGARWKPEIRDSQDYQDTQERLRSAKDENQYITEISSVINDEVRRVLDQKIDGGAAPEYIAWGDVRDVLEQATEDLKQDPRFWVKPEMVRRDEFGKEVPSENGTVFDTDSFMRVKRRINDAALEVSREFEVYQRNRRKKAKTKKSEPSKGSPNL